MTTETTTRPEFVDPTPAELIRRLEVQAIAEQQFVLDGSRLAVPVKYSYVDMDDDDVTTLDGFTAVALGEFFENYPWAGHNESTSAVQSAINISRATLRRAGHDLNTHGPVDPATGNRPKLEEPSEDAMAFALAMKWFHEAIKWADPQVPSLATVAEEV